MDDVPESGFWFDSSFTRTIEEIEPTTVSPRLLLGRGVTTVAEQHHADDWFSDFEHCLCCLERSVKKLVKSQIDDWYRQRLLADPTFHAANTIDARLEPVTCLESELVLQLASTEFAARRFLAYWDRSSSEPQRMSVTDESDVGDEASSELWTSMFLDMRKFRGSKRNFHTIHGYPFRHRTRIHALAHVSGLGHITLGRGNDKTVLLSQDRNCFTSSLKRAVRELGRREELTTSTLYLDGHAQDRYNTNTSKQSIWNSNPTFGGPAQSAAFTANGQMTRPVTRSKLASQLRNAADHGSYSSMNSSDSAASTGSFASASKRRRQSRDEGAFMCFHQGCYETFDRRCDLTQHERSHLPYEQRPYGCESCEKRFLFPKDLRRHETTHRTAGNGLDIAEDPDKDNVPEYRRFVKATVCHKLRRMISQQGA